MAISHRAGEFFAFSEGEYSDYSFGDIYKARVDFDMAQAARDFIPYLKARALLRNEDLTELDEEDDYSLKYVLGASSSSFAAYLISHELVEPIACDEIHVGSYGELCVAPIEIHAQNRAEGLAKQEP